MALKKEKDETELSEFSKKHKARFEKFVSDNVTVASVIRHRFLPDRTELYQLKMTNGTYEVRLYNKAGKKYRSIIKTTKASESLKAYSDFKKTIPNLPPVGLSKDNLMNESKKPGAKKPGAKKSKSGKKVTEKVSPKKPTKKDDSDSFFE